MTRSLIVDGTKEVIANGRAMTMHAISKPTDYTHTRIVGYAVTLEDANLFAASHDLRDALLPFCLLPENGEHETSVPNDSPVTIRCQLGDVRRASAAITKSVGAA